ncbi:hypothetical protein SAY87_003701 [Trapa incisa]|uniref:pectinesterase n=1 Tax=Trapa incisa TaxID=236973 RepID=A0AAN7QLE8_9MYRT|nr:hypothetical protein SAY87_003701 [Trapa incisa]
MGTAPLQPSRSPLAPPPPILHQHPESHRLGSSGEQPMGSNTSEARGLQVPTLLFPSLAFTFFLILGGKLNGKMVSAGIPLKSSGGDHGTVKDTATFTVMADNFMASGISFRNTYNGPIVQAPTMMVYGDKVSFYKCAFIGIQDTLGDMQGRHFYHTCNIEGAVDFIWGFGQSQFHSCSIRSRGALLGGPGYITAQGRQSPQDDGGFVFKYCNILGDGKTYLGRAYSIYARVLFYECSLGGNVVPQGWDPWKSKGEENDTTFCDSTCSGPGSDTSHRVAWMKKLEGPELLHLVSLRLFMDKEGWVEAQPVPPGWMGSRD